MQQALPVLSVSSCRTEHSAGIQILDRTYG
jgi:hypothetical protein